MDRVRFGRALGFGAKQAVKTLVAAVDAATAENPSGRGPGANAGQAAGGKSAGGRSGAAPSAMEASTRAVAPQVSPSTAADRTVADKVVIQAARKTARTVVQAKGMQSGLKRGGQRFGEAVWGPFMRLSGVLWLEVAGVFFGMFALIALGWGWRVRTAWHETAVNVADHRRLMGSLVMLALFGYFCVSSFVRARRRERGR